jgi:hypothetical protein
MAAFVLPLLWPCGNCESWKVWSLGFANTRDQSGLLLRLLMRLHCTNHLAVPLAELSSSDSVSPMPVSEKKRNNQNVRQTHSPEIHALLLGRNVSVSSFSIDTNE